MQVRISQCWYTFSNVWTQCSDMSQCRHICHCVCAFVTVLLNISLCTCKNRIVGTYTGISSTLEHIQQHYDKCKCTRTYVSTLMWIHVSSYSRAGTHVIVQVRCHGTFYSLGKLAMVPYVDNSVGVGVVVDTHMIVQVRVSQLIYI